VKLSTRGHYGVIAMTQLALAHGGGPVSLTEIAEKEGLSAAYLEQIFGALRSAGLVTGTRGVHGGYRLSRAPSEITVGSIIRVLDGAIAPVACVEEGKSAECCARESNCLTRTVWERMRDSIAGVLDQTTLADLIAGSPKAPAGPSLETSPERR